MTSRVAGLLAVLLVALVAAACAAPETATQRRVLRVASTQQIDSLNPFLAVLSSSTQLGRLTYEFLTTYDARTQRPVPALATSWHTSPDRRTWTFRIRAGVRWSDGAALTARDVAFTYDLIRRDPAARTANGNFVAGFESVRAPDDHTVVIRTRRPQATMLALDVPIVPAHVWSGVGDIARYRNDRMPVVGSGPFVLTGYAAGQFVRLRANDSYWRGRPRIDELDFVQFTSTDAAVQALRRGEVDLIGAGSSGGLTPAQFEALGDEPGVRVHRGAGQGFTELALNPGAATSAGRPIGDGNPALRDVRVRRAVAAAIDRRVLVNRVLDGYGRPGESIVPPVSGDLHWSAPAGGAGGRVAAARMLDAAGYRRGPDGVRVGPDGTALRFRLLANAERVDHTGLVAFLRSWLADVGIAVKPELVTGGRIHELTASGRYDLAISGWTVNPDPDYVLSIHTCGQRPGPDGTGATTDAFFCDPRYDARYAEQRTAFDHQRRARTVRDMQRMLYEQAPTVVLYYRDALEAYRSDRFAPFQVQPVPGGTITGQNGYWGLYSARPLPTVSSTTASSTTASASSTTASPATVALAALGGLVVGLLGTVLVVRRRRATADERE